MSLSQEQKNFYENRIHKLKVAVDHFDARVKETETLLKELLASQSSKKKALTQLESEYFDLKMKHSLKIMTPEQQAAYDKSWQEDVVKRNKL